MNAKLQSQLDAQIKKKRMCRKSLNTQISTSTDDPMSLKKTTGKVPSLSVKLQRYFSSAGRKLGMPRS